MNYELFLCYPILSQGRTILFHKSFNLVDPFCALSCLFSLSWNLIMVFMHTFFSAISKSGGGQLDLLILDCLYRVSFLIFSVLCSHFPFKLLFIIWFWTITISLRQGKRYVLSHLLITYY